MTYVHLHVCDAVCVAAFISGLRMYIKRVAMGGGRVRGEKRERDRSHLFQRAPLPRRLKSESISSTPSASPSLGIISLG